jgi:hypothetical protein
MKIRPVGAEVFHANGQIDMTKLIAAFRNFANAPKMVGRVFIPQNMNAVFNSQSLQHEPTRVWLKRETAVILTGHVCVHCFRKRKKKQLLFYAYRLTDFNFQNISHETGPVLCIPYNTCVYFSGCDSRHKRLFCVWRTGVCVYVCAYVCICVYACVYVCVCVCARALRFRMWPKTWIAVFIS